MRVVLIGSHALDLHLLVIVRNHLGYSHNLLNAISQISRPFDKVCNTNMVKSQRG